jgi:hypothetical protein
MSVRHGRAFFALAFSFAAVGATRIPFDGCDAGRLPQRIAFLHDISAPDRE